MGLMLATTVTDEMRAKWEAASRAREARLEYGRTVGDLRRLLKGARQVQIALRTGSADYANDVVFPVVSRAAVRMMFKYYKDDEFAPCEFDPDEKSLSIGTLRAIHKAQETAS